VSEHGTQVGIARARAGAVGGVSAGPVSAARPPIVDVATVRLALEDVVDPELPMVSIVALGMVGTVTVGPTIRVSLLPTFIGCPAIDLIRASIEKRLVPFGRPVEVIPTFDPPWTSDRITPEGLSSLAAAGIAPPADPAEARCPYCTSGRVVLDSLFGPTQCRSLYYCRDCRQPFEAIKPI
jgi:ring-1,2-phenylacetyl-CoA epoxidase subunit PaaD